MKNRLFAAFAVSAFALGLGACTVEQTEEGEMPEYEVQPADIEVDWDTTQVRTPDIDIVPDTTAPDTVVDTLSTR